MLEGISRRTVLEISQHLGLAVQTRHLSCDELRQADEVFISSSAGGLLPVTRLDGVDIGKGTAGPITRKLVDTYWAWHKEPKMNLSISY